MRIHEFDGRVVLHGCPYQLTKASIQMAIDWHADYFRTLALNVAARISQGGLREESRAYGVMLLDIEAHRRSAHAYANGDMDVCPAFLHRAYHIQTGDIAWSNELKLDENGN